MADSQIAVLLGSGASVDADIPHSFAMTDRIIEGVRYPQQRRMLEYVRHSLAANRAHGEQRNGMEAVDDVDVSVDVERLFAAVELLIDRGDQAWSPFVGSWHGGLEAFAAGSELRHGALSMEIRSYTNGLIELLRGGGGFRPSAFEVGQRLEQVIGKAIEESGPNDVGRLLRWTRDAMLGALSGTLSIDEPQRVAYLEPIIDLAGRQQSLTVATLNYDRSIEIAADAAGAECDTGLGTWLATGAFRPPEGGMLLLKLHGSIDWRRDREATDALPMQRIKQLSENELREGNAQPALIFGEAGKLQSQGPYLEQLLV